MLIVKLYEMLNIMSTSKTRSVSELYSGEPYILMDIQFFITATGTQQAPIHNLLGKAIVDACATAHREGRKFRVIIVIPAIPGFAGDLRSDAAAGTRAIMDYQYKSICRGENSIFGCLRSQGVDPTKYIFVFNLRSYDRINNTPELKKQAESSGVTYQQLQRAQAEEIMGTGLHGAPGEESDKNKAIKKRTRKGQRTGLKGLAKRNVEEQAQSSESESDVELNGQPETRAKAAERKRKLEERRADAGLPDGGKSEELQSSDSIAKNAMLGEKNVSEEKWAGGIPGVDGLDEDVVDQEKENFVQEQLYIHGKVWQTDLTTLDRIMLTCGSF